MRDGNAEPKRRDMMAIAAAPYLHQKLTPKDTVEVHVGKSGKPNAEDYGINVVFVRPSPVPGDENSVAPSRNRLG
jgi:hypothetical protein